MSELALLSLTLSLIFTEVTNLPYLFQHVVEETETGRNVAFS